MRDLDKAIDDAADRVSGRGDFYYHEGSLYPTSDDPETKRWLKRRRRACKRKGHRWPKINGEKQWQCVRCGKVHLGRLRQAKRAKEQEQKRKGRFELED